MLSALDVTNTAPTASFRMCSGTVVRLEGDRHTLDELAVHMAATRIAETHSAAIPLVVRVRPAAEESRFPGKPPTYMEVTWEDDFNGSVVAQTSEGTLGWGDRHMTAELSIEPGRWGAVQQYLKLLAALVLPSRREGALVHASGVVLDGRALVFLGESGAGKSTTARRLAAEGAEAFSDDMTVLRLEGGVLYAEPFVGDWAGCALDRERLTRSYPVAGAFVLAKGASRTSVGAPVGNPLAAWLSAVFSPALPPGRVADLLAVATTFARLAPPHHFDVAAQGSVLPALEGNFR